MMAKLTIRRKERGNHKLSKLYRPKWVKKMFTKESCNSVMENMPIAFGLFHYLHVEETAGKRRPSKLLRPL